MVKVSICMAVMLVASTVANGMAAIKTLPKVSVARFVKAGCSVKTCIKQI
jgi:hypothetical protein